MSVEYAHGPRGRDTFPRHWGTPEGETSEERSLWIFRNIATDQALERRGLNAAEVRGGTRSRMSGQAALAKVQRLRATS